VLRYSNSDRNMVSRPPGNWKWDPVWTSRHCLKVISRQWLFCR